MNSNKLLNEFNNLLASPYNVVLLDGPRGSGKTYLINQFIKLNKDKIAIYYVSLLGKKNVDDINTSLYCAVNGGFSSLTSVLPSSIDVFATKKETKASTNLDFVLKLDRGCESIIILDDLERYANTDYDEFLAYISNLVLRGSKIICVANLSELGSGELFNFNLYKEKIFDRVYVAELFNDDLLSEKFKSDSNLLDPTIKNLFNKNFRIVEKISNFYEEIFKKLGNLNLTYSQKKTLLFYIAVMINVYFNNKRLQLKDFKIRQKDSIIKYYKTVFENESDAWTAVFIEQYVLNTPYIFKYDEDYYFIECLLKAYLFEDFSEIQNFYTVCHTNKPIEMNWLNHYYFRKYISLLSIHDIQNSNITVTFLNKFMNIYEKELSQEEAMKVNSFIEYILNTNENELFNVLTLKLKTKDYSSLFDLINVHSELFIGEIDVNTLAFLRSNSFY